MFAVEILIALALTFQVAADARYTEPGGAAQQQAGASPQAGAPAAQVVGGGQPISAQQGAAGAGAFPPPSGGRAGDAYPGALGGQPTGSSLPGNSPLGSAYPPNPARTQPPPPNGGVQPIRDAFPGGLSGQAPPPRDFGAPPADAARSDSGRAPAGMMRAMLAAPPNSRLAGDWVTLDDLVAEASSRSEQNERIAAYWDLCSSVADYFLGLREQDEMGRLRQSYPRSTSLDQVEKDLAVRVGTAERAARASQLRLASLSRRGADRLPLPAHAPHCGSYQTRHDQVFAGRSSAEADELNQVIPLRYAELQDACDAVNRSQDWFAGLARAGMPDEATVFRALELLALQRRAFVQIARDYNRRISRYVELAAPGQVDPDRLIGMLIKRERPATATRPASATPTTFDRQSQTGADTRPTFASGADGWMPSDASDAAARRRDEAVTPVSAKVVPLEPSAEIVPIVPIEPGERSILVPKR